VFEANNVQRNSTETAEMVWLLLVYTYTPNTYTSWSTADSGEYVDAVRGSMARLP
jgi:hypothetical protein